MTDTKIRLPEATTLLTEDHRSIKKLFASYDSVEEDDALGAAEIFDAIRKEIEIHAQIEEEIFYPAVQGSEDKDGARFVREALEAHLLAQRLLGDLDALTPGEEDFNA